MAEGEFQDAALVIIGHGSSSNAGSSGAVRLHAEALRARRIFREVREAFWKQAPFLADVARSISAPRIFFIPLFISDGWFTEHVIPTALGLLEPGDEGFPRVVERCGQTWLYGRAVGSHPAMTEVLLARARGVLERHPFPRAPGPSETALVVVGHGTANSTGSRESVEREVHSIRSRALYAEVQPAFLEESPRVQDCFGLTTARNLVVVPFFMSDGLHVQEDIPVMLGEAEADVKERISAGRPTWRNPTQRRGRRVWCAPAIGTEPLLSDVILERVREAEPNSQIGRQGLLRA